MTKENFEALYSALKEELPEGDVHYDGVDTIPVKVDIFMCSGIFIGIMNNEKEGYWTTFIEMKAANGRLWERQLAELEGQKQDRI